MAETEGGVDGLLVPSPLPVHARTLQDVSVVSAKFVVAPRAARRPAGNDVTTENAGDICGGVTRSAGVPRGTRVGVKERRAIGKASMTSTLSRECLMSAIVL